MARVRRKRVRKPRSFGAVSKIGRTYLGVRKGVRAGKQALKTGQSYVSKAKSAKSNVKSRISDAKSRVTGAVSALKGKGYFGKAMQAAKKTSAYKKANRRVAAMAGKGVISTGRKYMKYTPFSMNKTIR